MARFLDDYAKVTKKYDDGEVSLTDDSGEESDEIPYQRTSRRLSSSGESDVDDQIVRSRSKSERRRKHVTKRHKRKSRSRSPSENLILSELKKTNEIMANLSKKMKRHESRLSAIENKLSEAASSSSSSAVTPKRSSVKKDVPVEVRVSAVCQTNILYALTSLKLHP